MVSELEGLAERVARGQLSRRQFLGQALAVGVTASSAGSLLAACSGGSGSSKGTIKVATYSYIPPNIDLAALAHAYTAKNPKVKISFTSIPDTLSSDLNAFVQKFTLEARQGNASYDLIFGPTPWVEIAPLARAHAVAPLDQYLPSDVRKDMPEPVRTGNTYSDGKMYGLPVWADVVGYISRKDLLQTAVGSSKPPGSWDQVVAMTKQLKGKLPSGTYAYGADWTYIHRLFLPIMTTFTDKPFTDKGLVNLDDPAALKALGYIQQLVPSMPPNSNDPKGLGSSTTFQAKRLAMESYWGAQYTRAVTAGVPASEIEVSSNPRGSRQSTLFWTTDVVLLKNSKNQDEAMKFLVDGLLKSPDFQKQSVNKAGKILPYTSMLNSVPLPSYLQPGAKQVEGGSTLPMNSAFEQVEYPSFQNEVEKMVLNGQSPQDTLNALKDAFKQYQGG